jgi:ribonuclease Z
MSETNTADHEQAAGSPHETAVNRRDAFRGLAAAAATAAAGVSSQAQAADQPSDGCEVRNPYGGGPNTGITLPPYYRPTLSVANANTFFPRIEELGSDEMRISFIGSSPVPPTRAQAGTAIMVELGNGKRFFFDLGPKCFRDIVALQVPMQMINDIFITHPHVDHYGELPTSTPSRPGLGAGSRSG